MKKNLLLSTLLIGGAMAIQATPLTPDEALSRLNSSGPARLKPSAMNLSLAHTAQKEGMAYAYIFNNERNGYIVLSADDCAETVLGYSYSGYFDANNIPPQMAWWLSEYGRQIEWARSNGLEAPQKANFPEDWTPIPPMVTSMWDQGAPYSNACPEVNGSRCVTGCVATAMAQIMYYYKYPEVGQSAIQYYANTLGKTLSLNFTRTPFDWDNMIDVYAKGEYTDKQAEAVAYLMKACGYSVRMNYNVDLSGTNGELVAAAAKEFFDYDGNTRSYKRDIYPSSEWNSMVYQNLVEVGPLTMCGSAPDGGHCFVCDGYDTDGYFHFNWGWSGISDGYYRLDALTPDAIGTGGFEGGFNYNQDCVLGMQPPTGEPIIPVTPQIYQVGYTTGSLSGNTLTFNAATATEDTYSGWTSPCDSSFTLNIGASFESTDGSGNPVIVEGAFGSYSSITVTPGSYYPSSRAEKPNVTIPSSLTDGKYKVTLVCKDANDPLASWNPILIKWSYPNYVYLTVSNGKYNVENVGIMSFKIDESEMISTLYYNRYVKIVSTVTNNNNIELSRALIPMLYQGNTMKFKGMASMVTLQPGETSTIEWITLFKDKNIQISQPTEFTLHLYDTALKTDYGVFGTVTMLPEPQRGTPTLMGFDIPGADRGKYIEDDIEYPSVFFVPNNDFTADVKFKVQRGFFDGVLTAGIYKAATPGSNSLVPVQTGIWEERPMVDGNNDTVTLSIPVSMPYADPQTVYTFLLQYSYGNGMSNLTQSRFMIGNSDVEIVDADMNVEPKYFNLQGMEVANPQPGQLVIEKRGDKTRKMIAQ